MGRVKTIQVKRNTKKLVELYGDKFKNDFDSNKKIVGLYAEIRSKKLRNVIAGYVTRLTKENKE